jgi:two-component system chemotaxis sensor kinase CheA
MKIELSQFRQTFLLESAEHVALMESCLLRLRSAPGDAELLNSIFRSAHSIKGGAGSFGLTNLTRFAHSLENLLDRLRSNEMRATDEVVALLLKSVDVLRNLLDADVDSSLPAEVQELEKQLQALAPGDAQEQPEGLEVPASVCGQAELFLYRIQFNPDREIFLSGTNPIVLMRNLARLGTVDSCHLDTDDLPALADLDPSLCYLKWSMELRSASSETELREVFEFVEHLAEIRIQRLEGSPSRGAMSNAPTSQLPVQAAPADQVTPPLPPPPSLVETARTPLPQPRKPAVKSAKKKPAVSGDSGSIRVSVDKVDRLIDLVGELVIAHVMTAQMVETFEPSCLPRLREAVAAMERNTRELHERVMSIRMLPVGTLFQRYTRTVYDIAQATGKQIRLETAGEDTEIDKSMLELLGDPLTLLIRNAADFGIEAPQTRTAVGKEAEGVIRLNAFHRAGRVVIEIGDDGAGIDSAKVRAKAIERGLISDEQQLSDEQLRLLIFEPGFSTREEVSDLSGRGVGMDVLKRNLQELHGMVNLASEVGRGSTVSIELPLTLAILEGLLVRVADRTLVLPLLSVIETVPLPLEHIVRLASQGEVVVIREESIPLLRLSRFLNQDRPDAETAAAVGEIQRRLAVIVQAGAKKVGLVVDELLGQQQVVVKSLERHLHRVDGLMGATILGDGCVAPIVDVAGIASLNLFSLQKSGMKSMQGAANLQPHAAA